MKEVLAWVLVCAIISVSWGPLRTTADFAGLLAWYVLAAIIIGVILIL